MTFIPGLLDRKPTDKRHRPLSSPSGYRLPLHIDRRDELLTASNQGQTSQCVAYALAGWLEFYRWKYNGNADQVDPEPIYKRAKQIDGHPNSDGTSLEAGLQAAQDLNLMSAVSQESIREVTTLEEVKQALHRYGVVFGAFNATDEWGYAKPDGWMQEGGHLLGGHAVLICGFSDLPEEKAYVSLQNSWGEDVGWRGFCRMSPAQFNSEFQYGLLWDFKT